MRQTHLAGQWKLRQDICFSNENDPIHQWLCQKLHVIRPFFVLDLPSALNELFDGQLPLIQNVSDHTKKWPQGVSIEELLLFLFFWNGNPIRLWVLADSLFRGRVEELRVHNDANPTPSGYRPGSWKITSLMFHPLKYSFKIKRVYGWAIGRRKRSTEVKFNFRKFQSKLRYLTLY